MHDFHHGTRHTDVNITREYGFRGVRAVCVWVLHQPAAHFSTSFQVASVVREQKHLHFHIFVQCIVNMWQYTKGI